MPSPAPGPHGRGHDAAAAACALLADFSLGMAWQEAGELEPARAVIPSGTRIHVGFVDSEDLAVRVSTVRAIRDAGFTPVPVIAARRLRSEGMLREYLAALRAAGASESVLVVAGDPATPRGPYPDAASVIGSGLLEGHGVRQVSMAGHPGGHPAVADGVLWAAWRGRRGRWGGAGWAAAWSLSSGSARPGSWRGSPRHEIAVSACTSTHPAGSRPRPDGSAGFAAGKSHKNARARTCRD